MLNVIHITANIIQHWWKHITEEISLYLIDWVEIEKIFLNGSFLISLEQSLKQLL